MLTEGNVESFTYLMISDCLHLFHFNLGDKLKGVIILFIFFGFIIYIVGGIFMVKSISRKNSKYFCENCKTGISSLAFVTF